MYLILDHNRVSKRLGRLAKIFNIRAKKHRWEKYALVGTGLSGTMYLVELAAMIKAEPIIIRKESPGTHHGDNVEGFLFPELNGYPYFILDDFVETGETIRRIENTMSTYSYELMGLILYNEFNSRDEVLQRGNLSSDLLIFSER